MEKKIQKNGKILRLFVKTPIWVRLSHPKKGPD